MCFVSFQGSSTRYNDESRIPNRIAGTMYEWFYERKPPSWCNDRSKNDFNRVVPLSVRYSAKVLVYFIRYVIGCF